MEVQVILDTVLQFFTQEGQEFSIWQQLLGMVIQLVVIAAVTFAGIGAINTYFSRVHFRQVRFVKEYAFPNSVRLHLTNNHPTLSDEAIENILDAFRDYVSICRYNENQFIAMPSKFVDCAWHGFVLATEDYQTFCKQSIGRFLHHHPLGGKKQNDTFAVGRTYVKATELSTASTNNQLPTLFSIDSLYGHAEAFAWQIEDLKKEAVLYKEHLKEQKRLEEKRRTEGADGGGAACGCGGSC
jgi:hypothetical protein